MSEVDDKERNPDDDRPKVWGPVAAIFFGLLIFIGAQISTFIILNSLAEASGKSLSEYFDSHLVLAAFIGSVTLGIFTVSFVYLATKKYDSLKVLKLKGVSLEGLLWVLPAFIGYLFLSSMTAALVKWFFPNVDLEQEQEIALKNAEGTIQVLMAFVALVIIAPISEELLFRGYTFQGINRRFHWIIAAVVSAGLFGLAHAQINVGIDTFALGVVACWLLIKTGSLWPAILLHGIKNLVAFYFVFLAN